MLLPNTNDTSQRLYTISHKAQMHEKAVMSMKGIVPMN